MGTTQHSQAVVAVMHLHVTHVNLAAAEQTPAQANRHDMSACILQNNRPHTLNIDPRLVSNVIWTCSSVNPLLEIQSAARLGSHRQRHVKKGVEGWHGPLVPPKRPNVWSSTWACRCASFLFKFSAYWSLFLVLIYAVAHTLRLCGPIRVQKGSVQIQDVKVKDPEICKMTSKENVFPPSVWAKYCRATREHTNTHVMLTS